MKKLPALFALIVLLAIAGCSSAPGAVQTVDSRAFLTAASQAGVTIVDVRTPAEYSAGHVSGAVNIDVQDPSFDSSIQNLDKTGAYAVYCHSGRRSAIATEAMEQAGFADVYNLSGGFSDLQAAGAVVESS